MNKDNLMSPVSSCYKQCQRIFIPLLSRAFSFQTRSKNGDYTSAIFNCHFAILACNPLCLHNCLWWNAVHLSAAKNPTILDDDSEICLSDNATLVDERVIHSIGKGIKSELSQLQTKLVEWTRK